MVRMHVGTRMLQVLRMHLVNRVKNRKCPDIYQESLGRKGIAFLSMRSCRLSWVMLSSSPRCGRDLTEGGAA